MENKAKQLLKELAQTLEKNAGPKELVPAADGMGADVLMSWNNYYGSWINGGWNNYYGSWSDGGWNNYYGSWSDAGWNNYYGSWINGGWNNYYGSWGDASENSGGCFLTTACVDHKGMADDCYEMQVLRAIRDTIVTWNDEMKELVQEYYRIAPEIVRKINTEENAGEIWDGLFDNLVMKCVSLYEQNKIEEAVKLYIDTVNQLKETYGVK